MDKKSIKCQNYITIDKFLRDYVGIENEHVIDTLSSLSHRDFKDMCQAMCAIRLTSIAFEDVTKENLETGDIILVADRYSHLAPYNNPFQPDFETIMAEERQRKIERIREEATYIYDLSNYEETYEEYVDTLDEIASDEATSSHDIKILSFRKQIN